MQEPLTYSSSEEDDAPLLAPAQAPRDLAQYAGELIGELESMTRRAGFDLLSYLLSMARAEAEAQSRAPLS